MKVDFGGPQKFEVFVAKEEISLALRLEFRLAYSSVQLNARLSFIDAVYDQMKGREPFGKESFGALSAYSANFERLNKDCWIDRDNVQADLMQALEPYIALIKTYPRDRKSFSAAMFSGDICALTTRPFYSGLEGRELLDWLRQAANPN